MRVARQRKLRFRQTDPVEDMACTLFGLRPVRAGVKPDALGDLLANRLDRVERRHRLLEHHADVVAAQPHHRRFGRAQYVDAVEDDLAARTRRVRQELHHRQCGHRLAGPRFADQPHDLAGLDRQVDVAQDRCAADFQRQVLDFEQAHRSRLRRGSSTSRRPSPRRLRPSTVMTIATPGKIAR